MSRIAPTPERLERRRQEEPPRYEDWAERQGFSNAACRFESELDELRRDTCDDLENYAPKGVDARTFLAKYRLKRQEIFENFWLNLKKEDER